LRLLNSLDRRGWLLLGAAALGAALFGAVATTGTTAHAGAALEERKLPMKFNWVACDPNCRGWVSAVGIITADTPRDFEEFSRGRQIIIFPEGTRTSPGAPPAYKSGVAQIYAACGVPCIPVALNSGLYWPRRKFLRYPGTIVLQVLDPIPPGLGRDEFMARLEREIEQATGRLTSEGEREPAYSRASA